MNRPDLQEQLRHVPMSCGVYVWKDAEGAVLYVGKAKRLRARMRSYFTDKHLDRPWISVMHSRAPGMAQKLLDALRSRFPEARFFCYPGSCDSRRDHSSISNSAL